MNLTALNTDRRPGRVAQRTPTARRTPNKRVRVIKKVRLMDGVWKFILWTEPETATYGTTGQGATLWNGGRAGTVDTPLVAPG
jgi:hypothetical protein